MRFRQSHPNYSIGHLITGGLWLFTCMLSMTALSAQEKTDDKPAAAEKSKSAKSKAADKAKADDPAESESPMTFVAPKQIEMLIGLKLTAAQINMLQTTATTAFPADWPEQKVEIVEVNVPPPFQHGFRDLPGGNKQLLLQSVALPALSTIESTIKVRIHKSHTVAPEDTSVFVIPKTIKGDLKQFMGNSPYIDPTLSEIRKVVREIELKNPGTAWERVEMLYDWTRDNIAYERGELKTVKQALKDKKGDCEEMTGIFVALCRAAKVPARCVWIPNHCYPEFYLEDSKGHGSWFPCQVAGTRNFGNMPEYLPILQKGDRFKVPEDKDLLRYLKDTVRSQERYTSDMPRPKVKFIQQLLGDAANLAAPDAAAAAQAEPKP